MDEARTALRREDAGIGTAFFLIGIRLLSVLAIAVVIWLGLGGRAGGAAFPPSGPWATLGLLPVNLLCLWLLHRRLRAQGLTFREALGVERGKVGRDIRWGLLWILVLNVPFMLAITATVFAMYGTGALGAFETMFFDASSVPDTSPAVMLVIAILSVIPFMLTNAPVEELVYRGYGLNGISSRWGSAAGIIVTSLLFGSQHVLFAASVPGMVVYFVAFTVWGAMAALIVRAQGRLFPVVISHWIVNTLLSVPGLLIPILQLAGVPAAF